MVATRVVVEADVFIKSFFRPEMVVRHFVDRRIPALLYARDC